MLSSEIISTLHGHGTVAKNDVYDIVWTVFFSSGIRIHFGTIANPGPKKNHPKNEDLNGKKGYISLLGIS